MKEYTRTDLALEKRQYKTESDEIVVCREERVKNAFVTELCFGKNAENGRYVTISAERLWEFEGEDRDSISTLIALEVRRLCKSAAGKNIDKNFGVLVAGLGNSDITADAIGPLTVKNLTVTRHLKDIEPKIYNYLGSCEISAFSPGVLGQTGIETVELIRGAAENSEPDVIIAVDALAARGCERIATVVQLSDNGISPGSGIGNTRKAINKETLGIPVISIGVPTVVDSSTLVYEALRKAEIDKIDSSLENVLKNGRGYFVTPKECDMISKKIASLLSDSISRAFNVF
ncbi:MAG: GPR endopeptidase [Clostridia bacterium]|nr:GPR endopeptidase [Clostridia bacterium]